MKYILLSLLTAALLLTASCNKEEEPGCPQPDFSLNTGSFNNCNNNNSPYLNISAQGYAGFFEIEYGPNGFTRGTGTMQTISGSTNLNGLSAGTYDLYARSNCGGTDFSEWAGPKSFLVQQTSANCPAPTNLSSDSQLELSWEDGSYQDPDEYELEYGAAGFSIGSGTRESVSGSYNYFYDGSFAKNTTYDFYVRARCGSNYSSWSEKHTFTASFNRNMCLPPTQVNVYSLTNFFGDCIGYRFEWDANGESEWELSLVGRNDSPGSGNIENTSATEDDFLVACGYSRDFYIRAVCANGNKTAWFGPKEVN